MSLDGMLKNGVGHPISREAIANNHELSQAKLASVLSVPVFQLFDGMYFLSPTISLSEACNFGGRMPAAHLRRSGSLPPTCQSRTRPDLDTLSSATPTCED